MRLPFDIRFIVFDVIMIRGEGSQKRRWEKRGKFGVGPNVQFGLKMFDFLGLDKK